MQAMDLSETLLESENISYLSSDYTFFPLTGLQVGRWLSAFHFEDQLFLFQPDPDTLVLLAVNSEGWQNANSQYFLSYTRKELLKMFKNSPFTTPVNKKAGKDTKGSFLDRLGAQYGGIVAFEINVKEIEGVDYSNTMNSYGSRLTFEVNQGKKKWFSSLLNFCEHYKISQPSLKSKYYSPYLSPDLKSFATKRLHPENLGFKSKVKKPKNNDEVFYTSTPNPTRRRTSAVRRSLSVAENMEDNSETVYESEYHECKFNDFTIAAYFEDPIFPFFVKNLLKNPKNNFLLIKYERGIPSWAQFLPSYGLPYRPWMRKVMAVIIFCFSLVTMLLGFYDLYKKIPELQDVLRSVLGKFFQVFEDAILIRFSVLVGYLATASQILINLAFSLLTLIPFISDLLNLSTTLFESFLNLFLSIKSFLNWTYSIFTLFGSSGWTALTIFFNSFYLQELFSLFYSGSLNSLMFLLNITITALKELKEFLGLLFSIPFEVVYGLTYGLFNVVFELFSDFYSFFYSIIRAFRYIMSIFRSNQGTVSESIGVFESIKNFWYDVFRHALRGVTSIYHFTVYTTCNVYKHKDSIIVSFWIKYRYVLVKVKRNAAKYKYLILAYILLILALKLNQLALDASYSN